MRGEVGLAGTLLAQLVVLGSERQQAGPRFLRILSHFKLIEIVFKEISILLLLLVPQEVFILQLVLHPTLADLCALLVCNYLLDRASVGNPLFLLLVPVMLPEVVIWLKNRHFE